MRKDMTPHLIHPKWVKTLPLSLEAFSLSNFGHVLEILYHFCGIEDALNIKLGDSPPVRQNRFAAPSSGGRILPFPNLVCVEFVSTTAGMDVDFSLLPLGWKRFQWIEHISASLSDYDFIASIADLQAPIEEQKATELGLRSLSLAAANDLALSWFQTHAPHLAHLQIVSLSNKMATLPVTSSLKCLELHNRADLLLNPMTARRLQEAGSKLNSLRVSTLDSDLATDAFTSSLIVVLSSLTVLDADVLFPSALPLLPATLRTLRVRTSSWVDEVKLNVKTLAQLPPGLTEFSWRYANIELDCVPLLPRTLKTLSFSPTHWLHRPGPVITDEMKADAETRGERHLYESITPKSRLLYGLPPGLTRLELNAPNWSFEENFGAFLPRSLLSLSGYGSNPLVVEINNEPTSKLNRLASLLGVSEKRESTTSKIRAAICAFPPECCCRLYFRKNFRLIGSNYVSYDDMKELFPPEAPLR